MKGKNNIILDTKSNPSIREITISESLQPAPVKLKEQLILNNCACHNENGKSYSLKPFSRSKFKKASPLIYKSVFDNDRIPDNNLTGKNLFRFFVKNGEHIYGRANDIIMIESCDHLVHVHLVFNDTLKKTMRANTLKDFLSLLPKEQFMRISRFCAININRLSGGSFNNQTFEFDFKTLVKVRHTVPQSVFKNIGK
ncbi:MAG TPA: LytTR family transcriptional regulator DNA-binding domain-containing protein [Parafilimonas sp.]|nr:LytTR family transcriptional regulator DNA-binding domain-containing protein [Parafilimonas sp.]